MDNGIVIGEGVVLDARPVSFATRLLAATIDLLALLVVWILLAVLTQTLFIGDAEILPALIILMVVLLMVVIPTTVEALSRGRSLGKLAMGIRIVRDDGGPIRVRHALIRALVGVGELWLTSGTVALFASISNAKGKRIGDLLAGTYAIRVRGGARPAAPIFMPYHLAGWARSADMRRLPDGLALSARQFLTRCATMHTASRVRVGRDLAATMEQYVAPGPPPGTSPESFILAVLAERRAREWVASQRAMALANEQTEAIRRLPYAIADPAT